MHLQSQRLRYFLPANLILVQLKNHRFTEILQQQQLQGET